MACSFFSFSAYAADLIVSANDAKFVRVEGKATYPENPLPDTLTVIDASTYPPKLVATVDVKHTIHGPPQAVAISPDGRWIAVRSMAGSSLPKDNPGRRDVGKIVLFEIKNEQAVQVSEAPSGEAAQGIVFTADSQYVFVQMNVEKAIGAYRVDNGKIVDTDERIALSGGPTSLRSKPR